MANQDMVAKQEMAKQEMAKQDMATGATDKDIDRSASDRPAASDRDLASEIGSLHDRLMRAVAETENTRRQGERRVQEAYDYAIADFARELLQVVDNLRRAIDAGAADREGGGNGLLEGVAATDRILTQILNRHGVKEVEALGQPFDPRKHEAVMETEGTDEPPGSVVKVLEDGYTLHDRLLRPARVVVAKSQPSSQEEAQW